VLVSNLTLCHGELAAMWIAGAPNEAVRSLIFLRPRPSVPISIEPARDPSRRSHSLQSPYPMMLNCWQMKNCGRQPGGAKTAEFGVCPASQPGTYDGRNGGDCGGRYCWKIAGTFCGGVVQGSFASKIVNCAKCEFFYTVKREQGAAFQA
jgi:hypothetical protein